MKEFISWLCITTFPDLKVTIENLVAEGEVVAAAVTLHATQTAPIDWLDGLGSIAPTGKRYSVPEFVFWRVVDGKITERRIIFDTWAMLQQLGVGLKLG